MTGSDVPWARGVVLCVTAISKDQRAAVQHVIELGGGSYSPNLSRRCTHLAVPADAAWPASDKLRIALRNQHKWGLQLVDLSWVMACAEAGRRLDEAAFPVKPPRSLLAPLGAARQEQVGPNVPGSSAGQASWVGSKGSVSAADTYQPRAGQQQVSHQNQQRSDLSPRRVNACEETDPLRRSVNSRPLSSFRPTQQAASLQTQAPSVKRSMQRGVRWQLPEADGESPGRLASCARLAPAVLPAQLEQRCSKPRQEEEGVDDPAELDFSRLPMTQAGFMPAADLLDQLRASTTAELLHAEDRSPTPDCSPRRSPEQPWQRPREPHLPAAQQPAAQERHGAAATFAWLPVLEQQRVQQPAQPSLRVQGSPVEVYAQRTSGMHPAASLAGSSWRPSLAAVKQQQLSGTAGLATADLLHQLRLSTAGGKEPPVTSRNPRQEHLATDALLQQLRAAAAVPLPPANQQPQQPALATSELLEQLRSSAAGPVLPQQGQQGQAELQGLPGQQQQQQHTQQGQASPPAAELPAQLHQQTVDTGATGSDSGGLAALLEQLRQLAPADVAANAAAHPSANHEHSPQQQQQRMQSDTRPLEEAPEASLAGGGRSTDELLQLLRQHSDPQRPHQQQPACSPRVGQRADGQEMAAALPVHSSPDAASPVSESGCRVGSADALVQQLRALVHHDSFTPLKQGWRQQEQQQQGVASHPQMQVQQFSQQAGATVRGAVPHCTPMQQDERAAAGFAESAQQQQQQKPQRCGSTATASAAAPGLDCTTAAPASAALDAANISGSLAPTAVVDAVADVAATAALAEAEVAGSAEVAPAASPPSSAGSGAGWHDGPATKLSCQAPDALAAGSQVAESGGGVFAGMLAVVDCSLPAEERQRVCAALESGGGRVADGGGLSGGVTHVVCPPGEALNWLSMGVGIVSPQWVLQSLRSGRQQRCLTVSADASRHLPAAAAASSGAAASASGQQSSQGGSSGGQQQGLGDELLSSREARQQVLQQLAASGGSAWAPSAGGDSSPGALSLTPAAAHQQAATPAELLQGVLWSVREPPAVARLEGRGGEQLEQDYEDGCELVIPDSEDEDAASLCCVSATQAAVCDVLHESASGASPAGRQAAGAAAPDVPPAAAAWQYVVVLPGAAQLMLLLPRDAKGELGLDTRCYPLGGAAVGGNMAVDEESRRQPRRKLTAGRLLELVHSYYEEPIGPDEQLQLLRDFPAAQSVAAVLRPAFLELAPVPRGALLGPRVSFEGLRKCTREPAGAVYEVQLGC